MVEKGETDRNTALMAQMGDLSDSSSGSDEDDSESNQKDDDMRSEDHLSEKIAEPAFDLKQYYEGKSKREVFVEMAMRDMFFMMVTKTHLYSAMSDFEIMAGFNQFQALLRTNSRCHEAMYGLGKINFVVKRYELA